MHRPSSRLSTYEAPKFLKHLVALNPHNTKLPASNEISGSSLVLPKQTNPVIPEAKRVITRAHLPPQPSDHEAGARSPSPTPTATTKIVGRTMNATPWITRTENPTTHSPVDWNELLTALSEPFPEEIIRFRAGATNRDKTKAIALAYADPRAYEDRLNALVPGEWQVEFTPWGERRIICHLTILGVTRSSTGESGDSNPDIAGTSAEAQAFKRACTKFGLGRYLYALPTMWVDYDPRTKHLLSTPELQPAAHKAKWPRKKPNRADNSALDLSETIGTARAVAMHEQLIKLGFERASHKDLAARALKRRVNHFKDLTEPDARTIWNYATTLAAEHKTTAA